LLAATYISATAAVAASAQQSPIDQEIEETTCWSLPDNTGEADGGPRVFGPGVSYYVSSPFGDDVLGDGSKANPFKTITHALSLVSAGDTVKVLPGTYSPWVAHNEETFPLNIVSGIALVSTDGAEATILDAVRESRVIQGVDLDSSTLIRGFTIRRGEVTGGESGDDDDGGGMLFVRSSLALRALIFDRNSASDVGGALCFKQGGSPTIKRCLFYDNRANTGGAIYAEDSCKLTVANSTISDNTANGNPGGAIAVRDHSKAVVKHTIIAYTHGLWAGAVDCDSTSCAEMCCSDVYNNQGGDWVGCIAGQAPEGGTNFDADPKFCDRRNRDYHLWIGSPCAAGYHPYGLACGLIGALPVNCSEPVPVTLAGFSAVPTEEGIFLEWTAAGPETGPFRVLRSTDGAEGSYVPISGELDGAEGAGAKRFSYLDVDVIPGTVYYYKLEVVGAGSGAVTFGPYAVQAGSGALRYDLAQNTPNPFTSATGTTIEFTLPRPHAVEIRILDAAGRLVSVLRRNAARGTNRIRWEGNYDDGHRAPAGIYFYQIRAGEYTSERKMLLVQ